MNLKVPFAEKDQAKKLGARWDAARKIWYVEAMADMSPFAKWSPSPHDGSNASPPQAGSGAKKQPVSSAVIAGSAFVEQECLCDCLPWDVCDKCGPTALRNNS
ncbi:DUF5710 domain-containing protein [Propionivibrio limicola]|uniref:DUF5710 domain-containing protein n=1 Tax=Propionivibrio limicola TaxID=167645 RepID=UPI003CCD3DD8